MPPTAPKVDLPIKESNPVFHVTGRDTYYYNNEELCRIKSKNQG